MNTSNKEKQILERFDLDDKKEEPFQDIIKTNRKKRIKYIFISFSILVGISLAIFLVLFFIKNGKKQKIKNV